MFSKIDAPIVQKSVTSADGTKLAYYVVGEGPQRWLMPPGMGAPLVSMKRVLERFARDFTIVTWDQRGFYGSEAPRDRQAMRMDDHLDDMHAVVEAEGLERFVLGGWSMAVQLSLEYAHRRPADVRALVLINGPFERALTHLLPIPGGEALAMAAARVGSKAARVLNPLSRGLLGARHATWALTHTGLLAADAGFFADVLAEFSRVDWGLYLTMTRQLHQHSAAGYLGELDTPTLVTAGARDLLTPVRMARRLHEGIRGSELVVFPKATHYIVAEVPEALCDAIADFFGRRLPG